MKFRAGDTVLVTSGKDKGKTSVISKVLPTKNKVVVSDVNLYVKHIKPMSGRAGERVRVERPLPVAKIAIINDKGQADRIGYIVSKSGVKTRIFKKTGKAIEQKVDKKTSTNSKAK